MLYLLYMRFANTFWYSFYFIFVIPGPCVSASPFLWRKFHIYWLIYLKLYFTYSVIGKSRSSHILVNRSVILSFRIDLYDLWRDHGGQFSAKAVWKYWNLVKRFDFYPNKLFSHWNENDFVEKPFIFHAAYSNYFDISESSVHVDQQSANFLYQKELFKLALIPPKSFLLTILSFWLPWNYHFSSIPFAMLMKLLLGRKI